MSNEPLFSKADPWSAKQIILSIFLVLVIALGFWLLFQIRWTLLIMFVSIVIGTAIKSPTDWLTRQGLSFSLAAILVYLFLLIITLGFILLLVPLLLEQSIAIWGNIPDYYQSIRNTLISSSNRIVRGVGWELPAMLPSSSLTEGAEEIGANAMMQLIDWLNITMKTIVTIVSILLLSFYWLRDGEKVTRSLLLFIPTKHREEAKNLVDSMLNKIGAYVRGQTILCIVVGALALAGYLIIGLPNALVLALIAGVMEAVPMIGPILGAVPAILIALEGGGSSVFWVIVVTFIIQILENNLLVPRIMDRSVGVNPILALLALAALGSLMGVVGALFAIPLVAILQIVVNRFILDASATTEQAQLSGRDYLSTLRYQTQDLIGDLRKQFRQNETPAQLADITIEDELEAIAADLNSILAQQESKEAQ